MTDAARLDAAYSHCETLLRDHDKDRFLADLFLPGNRRRHVHALHAFSFEIARIREATREPIAGELRQQWWRDAIAGEAKGEARANLVALAILDTIERCELPRETLTRLIDAREFDLYDDPMPDLAHLEAYCHWTSSTLFQLGARIVGGVYDADTMVEAAAGQAGLAYAYTGLIRAFALHAARGQIYLPGDWLANRGASREDVLAGRASSSILATIADLRGEARIQLHRAVKTVSGMSSSQKPIFLPLALVAPYLRLTEARGYDPFRSSIEMPQWRRQWTLWRAAGRLARP